MKSNLFLTCSVLLLAACSITEIVPAGKDTYLVAGTDEFTSGRNVKTKLYIKANAYCETIGKKLLPLNESVTGISAELRFRCLNEDDPNYVRPIMKSVNN